MLALCFTIAFTGAAFPANLERGQINTRFHAIMLPNLAAAIPIQIVRIEMEVVDGGIKDMVSHLFEVLVSPAVPRSICLPLVTSCEGGDSANGVIQPGGAGTIGTVGGMGNSSLGGAVGDAGDDASCGTAGAAGNGQEVSSGGGGAHQEALVLDYGDVYEGKLYQRRSFVIVNHATMPLEFQLSSSLPASELKFSLSAVTLKQFKSVHVEAKTRLQASLFHPTFAPCVTCNSTVWMAYPPSVRCKF